MKKIKQPDFLTMSRIELRCDGELILGASVKKRPTNSKEMDRLLKTLIKILKSPRVNHSSDNL
jgi:hypothetical protein